jgi:hypothetical protein
MSNSKTPFSPSPQSISAKDRTARIIILALLLSLSVLSSGCGGGGSSAGQYSGAGEVAESDHINQALAFPAPRILYLIDGTRGVSDPESQKLRLVK